MPTSSESTGTDKPQPDPQPTAAAGQPTTPPEPSSADFTTLTGDDPAETDKIDQAKAALELELQGERDARLEERFIWIIVSVMLVDVLWFRNAPNATFPIVILILEAVVLFILAKRMGVEEAQALFARLLESLSKGK